jgi:cytochrome c-type biogenesis protein CcmH
MKPRLLLLLALLIAAAPAAAQMAVPELTPEQARTAHEAMTQLRSPVTPFHTVDMCPSVPALRDTIRMAASEGQSREEIVEGVIARYGEQVRLLPKRRGAGLLAWIATPLVMLLGAGLIVARLRRGRESAAAAGPLEEPELTEEERARVAAALSRWEESGEVEP